ncbi:hypothetical protein BpHYR1_038972 [Brachionus plicatilis]|uniref:Uncharacterized protein n=1 Tax=Brachionus plicatilis TaxID=10195 RepID=A0A3M7QBC7_BRAPC|nr:hypothetical protein BpHYR1_038972 [Brachionus plicatilis]
MATKLLINGWTRVSPPASTLRLLLTQSRMWSASKLFIIELSLSAKVIKAEKLCFSLRPNESLCDSHTSTNVLTNVLLCIS